jgi:hypothetical protein
VGHATEDICFVVSAFFFIRTECVNTGRKALLLRTFFDTQQRVKDPEEFVGGIGCLAFWGVWGVRPGPHVFVRHDRPMGMSRLLSEVTVLKTSASVAFRWEGAEDV